VFEARHLLVEIPLGQEEEKEGGETSSGEDNDIKFIHHNKNTESTKFKEKSMKAMTAMKALHTFHEITM